MNFNTEINIALRMPGQSAYDKKKQQSELCINRLTRWLFQMLFVILVLPVFGQTKKISWGISGGPGITWLSGNDYVKANSSSILGFSIGASLQYDLSRFVALAVFPMYEMIGGKINEEQSAGGFILINELRKKYNYLSVPILIQLQAGNEAKFFVHVGPAFNVLLSQINYNIDGSSFGDSKTVKPIDIGIVTGIGFLVPVHSGFSLSFEVRSHWGLQNTEKPSDSPEIPEPVKINFASFIIGLIPKS